MGLVAGRLCIFILLSTAVAAAGAPHFTTNLDWADDTPLLYSQRMGMLPSGFHMFFQVYESFIPSAKVQDAVRGIKEAVRAWNVTSVAYLLITVEPFCGLDCMTDAVFNKIGGDIKNALSSGVVDTVVVRYGHEMNFGWYPWGGAKKVDDYIKSFRLMAKTLRKQAGNRVEFMWAPFRSWCGKKTDDPYGPWYPGDDVVDWVGLTLHYYMSSTKKSNDVPNRSYVSSALTDPYFENCDFARRFSANRNKKLAIPETSTGYVVGYRGATELEVKQTFWRQLMSPSMPISKIDAPLDLVAWFEKRKTSFGQDRDFQISFNTKVARAFMQDIKSGTIKATLTAVQPS